MRRTLVPPTLATAVALAVAAAGCGGGADGSGSVTGGAGTTATAAAVAAAKAGTPVTDAQALVLARLLQANWEHGGATLQGTIPVQGAPVELEGAVDFRSGRGEIELTDPEAQGSAPRRYVWTRRRVYVQDAPGADSYTVQQPDPHRDPVHNAIGFINLLSAETIDNLTNIQDQDARALGRRSLDGKPVDVYRYGADGSTTYWVDPGTGLLAQVQATLPGGSVIRLRLPAHGPQRVTVPDASSGGA